MGLAGGDQGAGDRVVDGASPKPSAAPPASTIRVTYASKYAAVPAASGMWTPAVRSSSPPSRYG
ncbi:hypothetical protein SGLAM104S_03468 [Streptomyces glaucescens]